MTRSTMPLESTDALRAPRTPSSMSDEELMEAFSRAGPEGTPLIDELVARHSSGVWCYFARRNPRDAEDLVQETFLRVVQKRRRYKSGRPFVPWLYALARNLLVSNRRRDVVASVARAALMVRAQRQQQQDVAERSGERAVLRDEEQARLAVAFARLSEGDREILRLARFEGFAYADIADIVGCTANAAKVRAYRALERLRSVLNVDGETDR